jgi:hypothetical protein
MEPIEAFPPVTPFTLQVTLASELPLTAAAYCEVAPSITVLGPVTAIETAASPPAKRDASLTTSPQAVRRSTKSVLKIAQVRVRQVERILFCPQATVKCQKMRRETGSVRRLSYPAGTEEKKNPAIRRNRSPSAGCL